MVTIKVNFFVRSSRADKKNRCPILCRLTKGQERLEFYTGLKCLANAWNGSKAEVLKRKDDEATYKNNQLRFIKSKLQTLVLEYQVKEEVLSLEKLKSIYNGDQQKEYGVLDTIDAYIESLSSKVDKGTSPRTVQKYVGIRKHLEHFINSRYDRKDYLLSDLKVSFLLEFQTFLTAVKNHNPNTVNKITQRIQTLVRFAMQYDWLQRYPFAGFKPLKYKKQIVFLSHDELHLLQDYNFKQKRLQDVKDAFIFCCYTGLAYNEFSRLRREHLQLYKGRWWLSMVRQKTGEPYEVPLLEVVMCFIREYNNSHDISELPMNAKLMHCLSNQKMNSYLKEIADIVGIEKNLSMHLARKTFASTVLLYNGVSMDVTSRMLCHSSITITEEHYGALVKDKLMEEMDKVDSKLKGE